MLIFHTIDHLTNDGSELHKHSNLFLLSHTGDQHIKEVPDLQYHFSIVFLRKLFCLLQASLFFLGFLWKMFYILLITCLKMRAARGWIVAYQGSCIDPIHQFHTLDPAPEVPPPDSSCCHSIIR